MSVTSAVWVGLSRSMPRGVPVSATTARRPAATIASVPALVVARFWRRLCAREGRGCNSCADAGAHQPKERSPGRRSSRLGCGTVAVADGRFLGAGVFWHDTNPNVGAKAADWNNDGLSKRAIDGRCLSKQRSVDGLSDGGVKIGVHLDVAVTG